MWQSELHRLSLLAYFRISQVQFDFHGESLQFLAASSKHLGCEDGRHYFLI